MSAYWRYIRSCVILFASICAALFICISNDYLYALRKFIKSGLPERFKRSMIRANLNENHFEETSCPYLSYKTFVWTQLHRTKVPIRGPAMQLQLHQAKLMCAASGMRNIRVCFKYLSIWRLRRASGDNFTCKLKHLTPCSGNKEIITFICMHTSSAIISSDAISDGGLFLRENVSTISRRLSVGWDYAPTCSMSSATILIEVTRMG